MLQAQMCRTGCVRSPRVCLTRHNVTVPEKSQQAGLGWRIFRYLQVPSPRSVVRVFLRSGVPGWPGPVGKELFVGGLRGAHWRDPRQMEVGRIVSGVSKPVQKRGPKLRAPVSGYSLHTTRLIPIRRVPLCSARLGLLPGMKGHDVESNPASQP